MVESWSLGSSRGSCVEGQPIRLIAVFLTAEWVHQELIDFTPPSRTMRPVLRVTHSCSSVTMNPNPAPWRIRVSTEPWVSFQQWLISRVAWWASPTHQTDNSDTSIVARTAESVHGGGICRRSRYLVSKCNECGYVVMCRTLRDIKVVRQVRQLHP